MGAGALAACGDDGETSEYIREATGQGDDDAESDGAGSADPGSGAPEVTIASSRFGPEAIAVEAGTTVAFTNTDPFAHTVTADEDSELDFDSGDLGEGEAFTVTFDETGTFAYFCEIHPTMRATVTVQ